MGVTCKIMLPNDVRIMDVGNVLGILFGLPKLKNYLGDGKSWPLKVEGADIKNISALPECADIIFIPQSTGVLKGTKRVMYHFEGTDQNGFSCRLLMPQATPLWIAAGIQLIKFFGGKIDFNDCDNITVDLSFDKSFGSATMLPRNNPEDGKEWQDFQKAMFNIEILTRKEVEVCVQWASCGNDFDQYIKEPEIKIRRNVSMRKLVM